MTFVITAGQISAIQFPNPATPWGYSPPQGIALTPTLTMTYQEMWRAQPQLRTVVGFLARNVAQLGVDVFQRKSDTDRVKLPDHPVAQILETPFPDTKITKYRLMNGIMHDLLIYDNAYLLKMKLSSGRIGVLPVSPASVMPLGSLWTPATKYRIQGNLGYQIVDADQIVHIYGYTPGDMRGGCSPIESLRQILAEEYSAAQYREQLWRNGARVAGYLRRPKDAPRWGDPARDRFKADWQSQYAGDGPQAGGTPILEDGMDFAAAGVSPRDAQYVESRKLTREEVACAYFVSPAMVGLLDRANLSSLRELHQMLYQDTLAPYLTQISQDLETQLLDDVDPTGRDGSIYIEFNMNEKLRGSFEETTSAFQSAVGGPWMTRNEARARNNLGGMPGGDELIVPLNVITGGLASPNDTAPKDPSTEGNPDRGKAGRELLWKLFQRQQQVVLSRIGADDGGPIFDQARWNAELADDLKARGMSDEYANDWAVSINERTASRLAPALTAEDPFTAVRVAFGELARELP